MNLMLYNNPNAYLVLAVIIFSAGVFTVLTRKNILGILMGIELMLNASGLNFITFAFFRSEHTLYSGHVFAIFTVILAAAETVVALAILLAIYHQRHSVMTDEITDLKG